MEKYCGSSSRNLAKTESRLCLISLVPMKISQASESSAHSSNTEDFAVKVNDKFNKDKSAQFAVFGERRLTDKD